MSVLCGGACWNLRSCGQTHGEVAGYTEVVVEHGCLENKIMGELVSH